MTKNIVCLDANFIVLLVSLKDSDNPFQQKWQEWQNSNYTIIAPTLMMYEVSNAFHRGVKAGQITQDEAESLLDSSLNLGIRFYGDSNLEISKESAREKSIRKGHISTLHLWWARRPLVAARAAVFASLIPAPESHQKRTALSKMMIDLCKWEASETTINKARKAILEAQRDRLGLPENTPLKEVPAPKMADLFAGGGAIPLEGLRLGCETYAIELNPVAHIIELCTLVYPQKYGKKLAEEVEKWGHWVIEKVKGKTYLSATDYQRYIPDESAILQRLEDLCNETGLTIPDEPVKEWSGVFNAPLYGLNNFGKLFTPRQLLSLMTFVKWVRLAYEEILQDLGVENEDLGVKGKDKLSVGNLGEDKNEELMVNSLGENTLQNSENSSSSNADTKSPKKSTISNSQFPNILNTEEEEKEFAKAVCTYLASSIDRAADFGSTLCTWNYTGGRGTLHTFSRQALPMVWDFAESAAFNTSGANYEAGIKASLATIPLCLFNNSASTIRCSSMTLPLETESLDAIITDPPYFDSVPYADLSDFFYIWLKRSIGHLYPEHFSSKLTPKKNEAIMEPSRYRGDKQKAAKAYEEMMHKAFCEANRVLKNDGITAIVYAHKTTAGWTTLIDSLRRAGFIITEAFPLDTERTGRLRAMDSAALASSIFLIARKRLIAI